LTNINVLNLFSFLLKCIVKALMSFQYDYLIHRYTSCWRFYCFYSNEDDTFCFQRGLYICGLL